MQARHFSSHCEPETGAADPCDPWVVHPIEAIEDSFAIIWLDSNAVVFDGGSTYLKWCEFAMTDWLQNRSRNPVNVDDGERFNQAEWRVRNKLFRNTISRIHSLPVAKAFFNFHLKPIQQYMDDGTGKKVLMNVGERPEWDKGTMRYFSQQIFLSRYMKKADPAAGVEGDRTLGDGEWVVRGTVEEMKGKNIEKVGSTHDILSVKNGKVEFFGLPWMLE